MQEQQTNSTNGEIMALKEQLIKSFGTQIDNEEYELLERKISAVVAAHLYAGNQGDNPLCILNRALETIINKRN